MKIAVTGYNGYVGSYIRNNYGGEPVDGDITNPDDMYESYNYLRPDLLIHCAAMTDVDECEKNPQLAFKTNVAGTMNVVNAFRCPIVYLSTDHVFNGKAKLWSPSERVSPDPINTYGLTKYAGEVMAKTSTYPVLVVRSSKLFDIQTLRHDINELRHGNKKEFTGVIRRNFTHRNHFVEMLMKAVELDWKKFKGNILHISSPVTYSYYQFWLLVADGLGLDINLISEREYPLEHAMSNVTPRPFYGGLDSKKFSKFGARYSVYDGINLLKKEFESG